MLDLDPGSQLQVPVYHLFTSRIFIATMKIALICSVALFLPVFASPTKLVNTDISEDTLNEITALLANITNQANTKRQLGLGITKTGFNADAQRVSNSGKYRYVCCCVDIE